MSTIQPFFIRTGGPSADLREAKQFGSGLTLRHIIKLKHAGVLR